MDILDSVVFDDVNAEKPVNVMAEADADELDELGELDTLDQTGVYDLNIKVFGVGGGGGNAVSHMAKRGIKGVKFVALNTDLPALLKKDKKEMFRIQLGKKTTGGKGAGGDPEKAAKSAEESMSEIDLRLEGTTIAVVTAGMGGGTGTGAAPVIARSAREKNILTFGVVTKPFNFEGTVKMSCALKGIAQLKDNVDALIIIPNQMLLQSRDPREKEPTMPEAFAMADEVVYGAVKGVADLLHNTTYINVDYADLEKTLRGAGVAHIAFGSSTGERKVDEVFEQLIHCPLLETSIASAKKVLVNINSSSDITSTQIDDLMERIKGAAHPDVEVVFGFDPGINDDDYISAFLIATAYDTTSAAEVNFTPVRAERAPAESLPRPELSPEPQIMRTRQNSAHDISAPRKAFGVTNFSEFQQSSEYKNVAGDTGAMPRVAGSGVRDFLVTSELGRDYENDLSQLDELFKRKPKN